MNESTGCRRKVLGVRIGERQLFLDAAGGDRKQHKHASLAPGSASKCCVCCCRRWREADFHGHVVVTQARKLHGCNRWCIFQAVRLESDAWVLCYYQGGAPSVAPRTVGMPCYEAKWVTVGCRRHSEVSTTRRRARTSFEAMTSPTGRVYLGNGGKSGYSVFSC